jgi:hypothetical protein
MAHNFVHQLRNYAFLKWMHILPSFTPQEENKTKTKTNSILESKVELNLILISFHLQFNLLFRRGTTDGRNVSGTACHQDKR